MYFVMGKWIQAWQANINIKTKVLWGLNNNCSTICTTRFLINPKFVSFCILTELFGTKTIFTTSRFMHYPETPSTLL